LAVLAVLKLVEMAALGQTLHVVQEETVVLVEL
jgi:hypothetical protein